VTTQGADEFDQRDVWTAAMHEVAYGWPSLFNTPGLVFLKVPRDQAVDTDRLLREHGLADDTRLVEWSGSSRDVEDLLRPCMLKLTGFREWSRVQYRLIPLPGMSKCVLELPDAPLERELATYMADTVTSIVGYVHLAMWNPRRAGD